MATGETIPADDNQAVSPDAADGSTPSADKADLKNKIIELSKSSRFRTIAISLFLYLGVLYAFSNIVSGLPETDGTSPPMLNIEVASDSNSIAPISLSSFNKTDRFVAPFDRNDTRPRIAIIIKGLGLSDDITKDAILHLPSNFSLAFSPYSRDIKLMTDLSIQNRHETYLVLPAEGLNFPQNDPGPYSMLRHINVDENLGRLDRITNKTRGIYGFIADGGEAFFQDDDQTKAVLKWMTQNNKDLITDLRGRDLNLIKQISMQQNTPFANIDTQIDQIATKDDILNQLNRLEETAQQNGFAIASAMAYPVTLETLKIWAEALESRNIALAPISAVIER